MLTKLACGYIRRSTDDQAGSLPAQRRQIEDYAKTNGYEIVQWFEDDSITGTVFDRPGLKALVAAAKNGHAWQYVLVWDRSRLGRPEDPREAIVVTYQIESAGKSIIPLHGTKRTDDPVINTILEALEFGQAGEESIRKSRDVLRGQMESALKGSVPNGQIPYACDAIYSLNGMPTRRVRWMSDRSKLVMNIDGKTVRTTMARTQKLRKADEETLMLAPGDPAKVVVVQRIFAALLAGNSPRSIAHRLNRDGVPAPRGKAWGRSTVIRVITNPAYKGTLAWNRQTWSKFHTVQDNGKIERITNPKKKWRAKPARQWVVIDGLWEGLVSAADWDKANAILSSTKPKAMLGKGAISKFLASGLLKCTCGSHFAGCSSADKRNPNRRDEHYRCVGSNERGPALCSAKRIRRSVVDAYLEQRLRELYFEPAAQNAIWREMERQLDVALTQLKDDAGQIKAGERIAEIKQEIARLVKALAKGTLTEEEADKELLSLRKESEQLQATLALKSKQPVADPKTLRRTILDACKQRLQTEVDLWPAATLEQRKAIIRAHVATMTADYASATITTEFYPLVSPSFMEDAQPGIRDTSSASCARRPRRWPAPAWPRPGLSRRPGRPRRPGTGP